VSVTCHECGGRRERKGWRGYLYCHGCRTPRQPYPDRPFCVACRRQMEPGPKGYWRCRACGVYCHRSKTPRAARMVGRPACVTHGRPMEVEPHARGGYRCRVCVRERRAAREADRERRETEAARLLSSISARLPAYLTPDEKDDATQQVALDILAGTLAPADLTPGVLRAYASRARGMVRDRFRFVSLSAPTRDGRELGEMLAA
jgi:hypothetical protein